MTAEAARRSGSVLAWLALPCGFGEGHRVAAGQRRSCSERFRVRYLAGGADVTAAVVAGAWETPLLAPGQFRVVRARIRVNAITPHRIERLLPARATSVGQPSTQDVVKMAIAAK